MRNLILGAVLATLTVPAAAPALAKDHPGHHDNGRHNGWHKGHGDRGRGDWRDANRYDHNRPDPRYGYYDASRYYRPGSYRERRLTRYDRVYRGNDGRYYCRRSDGTTGLIVGGLLGGLLGNTLANGHSTTLATVLGASGGALIGKSIDRGNVRCR
ncbi:MAG TPA: glycine zipper 2TM domain-containing protein [Sphingomonas sp.]|nr:glycine zipper 2TM domain-containing protein [Sphingomonas sp.]